MESTGDTPRIWPTLACPWTPSADQPGIRTKATSWNNSGGALSKNSAFMLFRLTLLLPLATGLLLAAPEEPVDFNREVRPLLSDRCYGCHGPDADKGRKAGLRLDEPEGATKKLKSGERAIVPGNLEESAMIARIRSSDPDEVMPPPELHRPLTTTERDILTRWVKQGAKYAPHWGFTTPRSYPAPVVKDRTWAKDPLDSFVLARIETAGLRPSPPAERAQLLRRASFALTGLPPSPQEVDAFVADTSPDAYEKRVDALLASPRYGEHLAVAWLDLSRYADTWGYTGDKEMFAWPWRDWVLKALNRNLPYDQFITEQLAGDLLPDPTLDQQVATAYNRIHRMTFEGGSIAEEFRQDGIADRIMTAGYGFMGLTMECSRCHDHKYDPISQQDYFSMAAMFGDIDENGLLSYHEEIPPPFVRLLSPTDKEKEKKLLAAVRSAEAALAAVRPNPSDVAATIPPPAAHYRFETLTDKGTPNEVKDGKPAGFDRHRPDQLGAVTSTPGVEGKGIALDGDGGLYLEGLGKFGRFDPFTFSAYVRLGEKNARATVMHSSGFYTGEADASGLELLIDHGRLRWSAIHLWPSMAASVETKAELPLGKWIRLTVTYDGSSHARGLKVYLDGRTVETTVLRDTLEAPMRPNGIEIGSRSRDAGFRNGALDEVRLWRQALTPVEVAQLAGIPAQQLPASDRAEHALLRNTPAYATAWKNLSVAKRELSQLQDKAPRLPCMAASPLAPRSYVLTRGQYDQPDLRRPVEPGVPARVFPWNEKLPRNRLGLARWLTDPQHPLTSRVLINRLWAQVFGSGLVASSENFGMQGDLPTHPELLDTLAVDFVRSGWDTKAMLRRLVLSSTFRQSSTPTAALREKDPANKLLARGPVLRLSAEMLRDQALLAAGLLREQVGGPSVKEDAFRRSVYTHRKRTAPPDGMLIFDAGSRETCQPKRLTTNTPLQALVLLNNPQFVQAARKLADRVTAAAPGTADRIRLAFRLVCTREPREAELRALLDLHARQAAQPASPGGMPPLAMVCSTLLASDAAVTSR